MSKNYYRIETFKFPHIKTKNLKAINLYENFKFFKINFLNNYYIDEKDSDAFLMGKYLYKPKFDYECFTN